MANNEDLELDVEENKGGSKKLIIIIVAVVLLLGGGGAAYYFLFMTGAEDPEQAKETGKPEAIYVKFRHPFNTNLMDGRRNRMVQIKIALLVRSDNAEEAINSQMPLLKSRLLNLISRADIQVLSSRQGKLALKKQSLDLINRILKEKEKVENAVEKVLFTNFVMQ